MAAGVPLDFEKFAAGITTMTTGGTTSLLQLLSAMQSEPDNNATLCIDSFTSTGVKFETLVKNLTDDTAYKAGKALKGDGRGSTIGFYLSNMNGLSAIMTEVFTLNYNCSFDYYFQGLGKMTQSLSGFMNSGTNLIFRAFMDDNTAFNTEMASGDAARVGKAIGGFMKAFFMVEIPSADLEKGSYYEKAGTLVMGI